MPRPQRDAKLEQFWRRHLQRQGESGLTVRDYCRQLTLRESSFYAWRRIIRQRDEAARLTPSPPPAAPTPVFLPVSVVDARPLADTPIHIRLTNGCRLRVRRDCDRQLLSDVLALLTRREDHPC